MTRMLSRRFDMMIVQIDTDRDAARGLCDCTGKLPDNTETDHDDSLAKTEIRLAQPLHRDRAERCEAGGFKWHVIGDLHAEIAKNPDNFRVIRTLSATGDSVAGFEIIDVFA